MECIELNSLCKHMNKKLLTTYGFMCWISTLKFISYKPRESRDIDLSNSHVTSCWLLDQRVMFGNLLHKVRILPSVVLIHLLQVEICILFVAWPHKTTPLYVMHKYGWELLAACHHPEKLIIGILIVERKNASSETRIL